MKNLGASSEGVTNVLRKLALLTASSLLIGLFLLHEGNAPSEAMPARADPKKGEEAKLREAWREWSESMAKLPLPTRGTFEATYPNKEWKEVKYTAKPKLQRMQPRRGPRRPLIVGDGNNVCAQAPSGLISSATDSFDGVTGMTSEIGQFNAYSLLLNALPRYPMTRRCGPRRPFVVGNGNDVCAQAPSGLISSATGSFDSVAGVTNESGQVGGVGPPVADAYTLQLNTNFFTSTVAGSPPGCQGWEQFVFENDGAGSPNSYVFIQYWLINYGVTSPPGPGWWQFGTDWYQNSTMISIAPTQPITNLSLLTLGGSVWATGDSFFLSTGSTAYAGSGDNLVNAAAGWNIAEFIVCGDGGGGQANFNAGSTIVTRTQLVYGGVDPPGDIAPPVCVAPEGYTAETNNLNFGPAAPAVSLTGPALLVMESSAGMPTASSAYATTVGGTAATDVTVTAWSPVSSAPWLVVPVAAATALLFCWKLRAKI